MCCFTADGRWDHIDPTLHWLFFMLLLAIWAASFAGVIMALELPGEQSTGQFILSTRGEMMELLKSVPEAQGKFDKMMKIYGAWATAPAGHAHMRTRQTCRAVACGRRREKAGKA
jgi:hypothetical protein